MQHSMSQGLVNTTDQPAINPRDNIIFPKICFYIMANFVGGFLAVVGGAQQIISVRILA